MTVELSTTEQRDVDFYGDTITAIKANDGDIYAPLREMCDALGIDVQAQRRRIGRHEILSDGLMVAKLATIQGDRPTNVLRADLIPFWLSGIRASAVEESIRPKLVQLQKNAANILWKAFQSGELTADDDELSFVASIDPEAAEALAIAEAVVKMARSHVRLLGHVARQGEAIESNSSRLDAIEAELGNPARLVSQPQQMEVTQAVKAVAHELGQRSGRNEFGGVYGELYRRFEVTSYKLIPAAKHSEAMAFLSDWHSRITGKELPF